jgi:cyclase
MRLSTSKLLPLAAAALLVGAYVSGSSPRDLEAVPVGGNVSYLVGAPGGNIGVSVGDSGLLVVDDKFARNADEIDAVLAKLGDGAPRFLINTHAHGDHTGSNAHFGAVSSIVAHRNVRVRLAGEGMPPVALPVVTYDDGISIHFNGEEVHLIHVPTAHTDGDTAVWFEGSNVLHTGDLYFQSGYPVIDISIGGNAVGLVAGLDQLLALVPEDARVIPGHGDVTGVDGLREYRDMLATILDRVRELHAEGFSVDEILEAEATADYDERWGGGYISPRRLVESMLASL